MYKLTIKFKEGKTSTIMYVSDQLKNKVVKELLTNSGLETLSHIAYASVVGQSVVEFDTEGGQERLDYETILDYIKAQTDQDKPFFYVYGDVAFYTPNVKEVKAVRQ